MRYRDTIPHTLGFQLKDVFQNRSAEFFHFTRISFPGFYFVQLFIYGLNKDAQSVAAQFPDFRIIFQEYRGKPGQEFPHRPDKKKLRTQSAAVPEKRGGCGGGFGGERTGRPSQEEQVRMEKAAVAGTAVTRTVPGSGRFFAGENPGQFQGGASLAGRRGAREQYRRRKNPAVYIIRQAAYHFTLT
jgi:hypothetical protein